MLFFNMSLLIHDVKEVRKCFYHCAVFFKSWLLTASSKDLDENKVPVEFLVDDPSLE
jgi:hypothetical protein